MNILYAINLGGLGNINFPNTRVINPLDLIANIIWVSLELGVLIALITIVYAGVMYVTAGDNTDQTEKAKKTITWSIIGLVLLASSLVIVRMIISTFNTGNPFP